MFQIDDAESCSSCSHSRSERLHSVSTKDGKIYACLVDVPAKPPTSRDAIYTNTSIFASCVSCGLCKPNPPTLVLHKSRLVLCKSRTAFLYHIGRVLFYSYKLPYCFQRSLKKKKVRTYLLLTVIIFSKLAIRVKT